jgi:integrase/recombinase XerD
MTPFRQQMLEAMRLRSFSPRTHESYLEAVEQLAHYHHCRPDRLSPQQIQTLFVSAQESTSIHPPRP